MADQPMAEFAATFLSALSKLPPYRGLSYRGFSEAPSEEPWSTVSPVVVPTSLDPRVATENFTAAGLYAILGRTGKELTRFSKHPEEREVVFAPGTIYKPVTRFDVDGLPVLLIEQIDPDRQPDEPGEDLDVVERKVQEAVRAARAEGPVGWVNPGKFVGGLS